MSVMFKLSIAKIEEVGVTLLCKLFIFAEQKWKEDCQESTSLKVGFHWMCSFVVWINKQTLRIMDLSSEDFDNQSVVSPTGLSASLERLQLDYIDVVFANRPDPNTPIEGVCLELTTRKLIYFNL